MLNQSVHIANNADFALARSAEPAKERTCLEENIADIFTKSLPRPRVERIVPMLGLVDFDA